MNSTGNEKANGASCGGGTCCGGPGKWILIALVMAIAVVMIAKMAGRKESATPTDLPQAAPARSESTDNQKPNALPAVEPSRRAAIPRLVDLGATKCIPCKMMAPILEDLKKTYAGKFDVQFIDVWENPDAGKQYGINVIPTQIFYDAAGKELFRHEGFFGKDDILGKWKELGF